MIIALIGVVAAGLAMFTYDQPVLIMVAAACGGIFLLVQGRKKWPLVGVIWGGCGIVFLANILAKVSDPAKLRVKRRYSQTACRMTAGGN
jgi:cell division protein FtsW (lipid II flippase)